MSIEFRCLQCEYLLRTPDEAAGKKSRCPHCGNIQDIPRPAGRAAATPDPFAVKPQGQGGANPFPVTPPAAELNPYQAPASVAAYGMSPVLSRESALSRIRGPAIAFIVLAVMGLLLVLLAAVGMVVDLAEGNNDDLAPGIFGMLVMGLQAGLMLIGGLKMKDLRNYGLSLTAAICAVMPCVPCFCLNIGFGIWAIAVLADSNVNRWFR